MTNPHFHKTAPNIPQLPLHTIAALIPHASAATARLTPAGAFVGDVVQNVMDAKCNLKENRNMQKSYSTWVTYFCVDCGKPRTGHPLHFNGRTRENYRCIKCSAKVTPRRKIKAMVTYFCIGCGKSRTTYPSNFGKTKENYRCRKCSSKINSKKLASDPAWIIKNREGAKKRSSNENWRRKQKENALLLSRNPVWREAVAKRNVERMKNPESVDKVRKSVLKLYDDPGYRKRRIDGLKRVFSTEEYKNKHMEAMQKLWQNPQHVERFITGGFWYGNPIINNRYVNKYCEKWNMDLRKRIDAAWDYRSSISGKSKSENKGKCLHRHHVYWQKKACCEWDSDVGGYYVMINIGSRSNPDMYKYYIKGDPNKFVLLTSSEHAIVRGNKKRGISILDWIKYFEELVLHRESVGKKCYLSKQEYIEYLKLNDDVTNYYKK